MGVTADYNAARMDTASFRQQLMADAFPKRQKLCLSAMRKIRHTLLQRRNLIVGVRHIVVHHQIVALRIGGTGSAELSKYSSMHVVADVTGKTLQQVVDKTVAPGAKIECDGYRSYRNLSGVALDAKKYEPGDLH